MSGAKITRYDCFISQISNFFKNYQQENGKAEEPNLLGSMIQEISGEPSPEERENLTWAALGTLGGGLDTVRTLADPKLQSMPD